MTETLGLIRAFLSGIALGAIFFGGLWWTVRRGVLSKRPALWSIGSLVVRMTIVLAGFYWVSDREWQPLLLCMLGFIVARPIVARMTRRPPGRDTPPRIPEERPAP